MDEVDARRLNDLEDQVRDQERFLEAIEAAMVSRLRNKGFTIIPLQPPRELLRSLGEIQRGKRSKDEFLRAVYSMIVVHFRKD